MSHVLEVLSQGPKCSEVRHLVPESSVLSVDQFMDGLLNKLRCWNPFYQGMENVRQVDMNHSHTYL